MDYADAYNNLADDIRTKAKSTVKRHGALGTKPLGLDKKAVEDENITLKYLNLVGGMFPEKEDTGTQEVFSTSELAPEESAKPKAKIAGGELTLGEASNSVQGDYTQSQKEMEETIAEEATLRGIDPTVAIAIFRSEGAGAYQSQISRKGEGSLGGKEASFGPYQLYTGGGLGNKYEKSTGRSLINDNSKEGVRTQIQFALDQAVTEGWTPWYGRKTAGVSARQGLSGAKAIGNWKTS